MATATKVVTCNSGTYTQLTAASTGYALVYNPADSGNTLLIYNGSAAPASDTKARMMLNPDDAFRRSDDITDHLWGKLLSRRGTVDIAVIE